MGTSEGKKEIGEVRGREGSGVMNDDVWGEESGSSVVGSEAGRGERRESLRCKPQHVVLPSSSSSSRCCSSSETFVFVAENWKW